MDTVDVEGARPRRRTGPGDGLVGSYLTGPCAAAVARWAGVRGITARAVSASSLALAGLAAVWFSAGVRGGLVAGALLLAASLVLGQAGAGLRRRASPSAARPDTVIDRAGELAVYAGLAAGAAGSGAWWSSGRRGGAAVRPRHGLGRVRGGRHARRPRPSRRGGLARRAAESLRLPVGERFALIALTAALADARPVFTALLAWGSAAAALTLGGRVARSLSP
ncbi:hypothetical protein ACFQY7_32925 [Actinomadura luteofluorescens]|uniref:hypothetical protein n=1 Tax=Actinomadura luteofluorescens TaxID=46163 RepID=UPI0036266CB8